MEKHVVQNKKSESWQKDTQLIGKFFSEDLLYIDPSWRW